MSIRTGSAQNAWRRGFTNLELIVTVAIVAIVSGFAAMSYMGFQDTAKLRGACDVVASTLRLARQGAVTRGQPRRVVIETVSTRPDGSFIVDPRVTLWVERQVRPGRTWNEDGNYEAIMSPQGRFTLPNGAVVADVNGVRVFKPDATTGDNQQNMYDAEGDEQVQRFYIVFSGRGSVEAVYWHACTESYGEIVDGQRNRFENLALHVALMKTEIALSETVKMAYVTSDLGNSVMFQPRGNCAQAPQLNAGGKAPPLGNLGDGSRGTVGTIFVISLTGRAEKFDYGRWYPFSEKVLSNENPS